MITIVYWRICLLFVFCGCQSLIEEDWDDDNSFSELERQSKIKRVKNGTPLSFNCHQDKVKWHFKPCDSNFYGITCNRHWRRLENVTKGRLRFDAAVKEHTGLYKCTQQNGTEKVFLLDVYDPRYNGKSPKVSPLKISNITGPINMEFTIQCKVTSDIPPTIIWFKSCFGHKCDVPYHEICYCHINTSITSYNSGSTYFSKYLIFNARDVDSGTYVCLAVNEFGKDKQNVTINVPCKKTDNDLLSLLFLIPFGLLLMPLIVWLCYFEKRKKSVVIIVDQQKQLIRPSGTTNEIV